MENCISPGVKRETIRDETPRLHPGRLSPCLAKHGTLGVPRLAIKPWQRSQDSTVTSHAVAGER